MNRGFFSNWYPLFTLIFYFMSPFPTLFARRYSDDGAASSALKEFCYFMTTGLVLSAFALSAVLAHTTVIHWGAAWLVFTGNLVMFATIYGFFVAFDNEDGFEYSSWGMGTY